MKNLNRCGVYEIINTINGKRYVGSSVNIRTRWNYHKGRLRRDCHSNYHLQNAWNKYGSNAFEFRVLVFTEPDDHIRLENILLDTGNYEYNIATRATFPYDNSGENNPMYGKEFTEEHRRKLRKARANRIGMFAPCYGKKKSKESKIKISNAVCGKNHPRWVDLSDDEIAEMKLLKEKGRTIKDIAEMFGVSWRTAKRRIYDISRSKYA
jgi:group I intron endonuclease